MSNQTSADGGKMDAEMKGLWLKALRSGKYKQGEGALCKGGKYCCLGVLVDAAFDTDWIVAEGDMKQSCTDEEWVPSETQYDPYDDIFEPLIGGELHELTHMNDNGASFAEIADYIEESL